MRDSCLLLANRSADLKNDLTSLKYYCRIHVVLRDIPGVLIERDTCLHAQEGRSNIFMAETRGARPGAITLQCIFMAQKNLMQPRGDTLTVRIL